MHQAFYAEVLEDDQGMGRSLERRALDHAVDLLERAAKAGVRTRESVDATYHVSKLWQAFIGELVDDDNALPVPIRANLISIGIWILKEVDAIRLGKSDNHAGIAGVCALVRDGLR